MSILISGAGIAGPALALLLNKHSSFKTTIVERAPSLRAAGQQIDVAGPGLDLIRFMGVEAAIRARTVHDEGIHFVNAEDKPFASFPASSSTASLVREIEIMRGDLAEVFYEASRQGTEYIFDDSIVSLSTNDKGRTTVEFKYSPARTFDLVVAADGLNSRTRDLAFPDCPRETVVKNLGQWGALFTIPHAPSDGTWSRTYSAANGRVALLRPDIKRGNTGVYLMQGCVPERCRDVGKLSQTEQKELVREVFGDLGWEVPRALAYLENVPDFYILQVGQVKMPQSHWHSDSGRVALLGDAGYCPAPVSGLGTTMALVGAYVLAGNLVSHPDDLDKALEGYERDLRPFVDSAQSLGPGVPDVVTPHAAWKVWALGSLIAGVGAVVGLMRVTGLGSLLGWVFWPLGVLGRRIGWVGGVESMPLPVYGRMGRVESARKR